MKGQFYTYIMRDRTSELYTYIASLPLHRTAKAHSYTFPTLMRKLEAEGASRHILDMVEEKYREYMEPAARLPTKAEKEQIVLRCLERFQPTEPTHIDERYEFVEGGFTYYIRRSFLQGSHEPLSERDVEYRIQASNSEFCRTKKESAHWSCWVYINRPGYLSNGTYPSIPGTDYGVQWYKGF